MAEAENQSSDTPRSGESWGHNVVQMTSDGDAIPERERAERSGEKLRIAMLAPPWIPVPPPGYGGIEEVVDLLTNALVDHGHDVDLFCAPGSSSRANVR